MHNWYRFLFSNKRLLSFGFLFNFFSSFGQTFFIAIFVPFWIDSLGITNAAFGSMYATVTIISAFLLSMAGRYIDSMSIRKFGLLVFGGLSIAVIILSQARSVPFLVVGLLLVRWFGQGMMTHTSSTGIAKIFDEQRGKALGFTALGHPAGQFFIPLLLMPLIAGFDWRIALLVLIALAAIIVIPTLLSIPATSAVKTRQPFNTSDESKPSDLLTVKFWLIASNIFIVPFLATAIFLYQYTIAEIRGWEREWVTFSFAFFAIANALALIISGDLTDRYTGKKLFPLYLIPAFLGLLASAIFPSKWMFPILFAMLGVSTGLGSTIKTAMQTEAYGPEKLGKIRSYFSTILIVSTALGPPVFGLFLDNNYSFALVMGFFAVVLALIILLSFKKVH